MKLKIFSVFDSKAAFFGNPFYEQHDASAIRAFSDAVAEKSNPNNMWAKHPEDFSLTCIGEFDNETGEIKPQLPISIVTASAIQTVQSEDPPK